MQSLKKGLYYAFFAFGLEAAAFLGFSAASTTATAVKSFFGMVSFLFLDFPKEPLLNLPFLDLISPFPIF